MPRIARLMAFSALVIIPVPVTKISAHELIQSGVTQATQSPQFATLKVPGATLYYETTGSGPTLLIIPGGPQDAGVFAELAAELATRFKVVTYDPRGNSRSTFDGEIVPLDVNQQADDAAALIQLIGAPAYVFGTSGGAQIGLDLTARHPQLIRSLVAHEPPSMMLLHEPEPMLAADRALYETYKTKGVDAAMTQFFSDNALDGDDMPGGGDMAEFDPSAMPPETAETFMRVSGNFEYWLAYGMLPLSTFVPDVATLRAGAPKVIVAIGEGSAGQPIEAMSLALSNALGVPPMRVPGDHSGFEAEPAAFARQLESMLE